MPARAGQAKADAGKPKRNREIDHGVVRRSSRPTLPEIEPLYSTLGQPRPADAYYDEKAAARAVKWIESRRHYKGRWAGTHTYLLAWQIKLVEMIFGWKRADGTRLYRLVYVEAPRKSGKTTLASLIALYLAHADAEAAPEIYFAAYDKDQAAICFDSARFITEKDPALYDASVIYNSKREMVLRNNPGGFMRTLSKEVGKLFGINLHGSIFDELMTQRSRDLWNALTTSEGSRDQPLIFAISTAGFDRHSVCFEQHELTRQIQEGVVTDSAFLGIVYGAPIDADWTSEDVWLRANPSLGPKDQGGTVDIGYYRTKYTKAKNQPLEQNAFRTLLLSQWVGQAERFLDMGYWDACDKPVPPLSDSPPLKAFGGLDLAATTDLTALVIVAGDDSGPRYVYPYVFLPAYNIAEREREDRVPYRQWAKEGYLTLTDGKTTDYGAVRKAIEDAALRFDLKDISFDRWNATQLVGELEEDGLTMFQMGQGILAMSPPTKELLRLVTEAKLAHGGHPLLRWCASNAAPRRDSADNVKLDKERSAHRIDPLVALTMAIDGWSRRGRPKKQSVYETRYGG